ncbi:MAG: methylated-DNA--[protein]-cysteine S-methyltransferase [Muribaculaceae bacterium]|nr:methylated-DNA--[protein]-cysteine S-methyltransferase [Muribaculaceae bacterium]
MWYTQMIDTPCGKMALGAVDGSLCMADWLAGRAHARVLRRLRAAYGLEVEDERQPVFELCRRQLDEYFSGKRRCFDLPLQIVGTPLQQAVWLRLSTIPYGTTVSYGQLAAAIGHPTAVRAVASAVGANPLSIVLPCHRVVGADGSLTGYAGGLAVKAALLALETV